MMQKKLKLIAILLAVLLLAGCGIKPSANNRHQQGNDKNNNAAITLSVTPLSADIAYQLTNTIVHMEASSSQRFSFNYKTLAQNYVQSLDGNDEFATYYRTSDYVEAYPIFGTYLEPTGSVAYLFYLNDCPFGIAVLSFDSGGNVEGTPICKNMTTTPAYVEALSIEDCYMAIISCLAANPDFDILGVIFDSQGYPAIYPVGKQRGDTTIKYMAGHACAFSLVDPFETIEEGYKSFKDHLSERKTILSEITIYPWTNMPFYDLGYIREFEESITSNQQSGNYAYIEEYDSLVAIPLLSPELNENVYILHLLYYHNQLIAEVVIKRDYNGTSYTYSVVWDNVAAKMEGGQYDPLIKSKYVSVLDSAVAYKASWSSQGVVYSDGEFIPVGMCEGKLVAFDYNSSAVREYK